MKKLICLCLGLILCGCTGALTAQNDEVKKVNVNVIEVSASSIDEIEEMAIKDVEETNEKLKSERDALGEGITDYNSYTKNLDKVKTYYEVALKQTELLSIRLREYAYKYAELIMMNGMMCIQMHMMIGMMQEVMHMIFGTILVQISMIFNMI